MFTNKEKTHNSEPKLDSSLKAELENYETVMQHSPYMFKNSLGSYIGYCTEINQEICISNFIIHPIYFIKHTKYPKQICRMVLETGEEQYVIIERNKISTLEDFVKTIESFGTYVFSGTQRHFEELKYQLSDLGRVAHQVDEVGWSIEGCMVYSNGIFIEEFHEKNPFHIVKCYYYVDHQNTLLEDSYQYVKSSLTLKQFLQKTYELFPENLMVLLPYVVATVFIDFLLRERIPFPTLLIYGQGDVLGRIFQKLWSTQNDPTTGKEKGLKKLSNVIR